MGLVGVGLCRLPLLGRPLGGGGAVSSIFMGGGNGVCAGQKNKIIKYKKDCAGRVWNGRLLT